MELLSLNEEKDLPAKSNLKALRPFLDTNRVMRVGGRLHKSHLNYAQKHPVILHCNDHLSHLIQRDIHESHLHAGPQQMVAVASQNYHIRSCKRLARSIYRGCITCRKLNAITYNQVNATIRFNVCQLEQR